MDLIIRLIVPFETRVQFLQVPPEGQAHTAKGRSSALALDQQGARASCTRWRTPAHQLSQAQRQWSVLPRAAEACAPCLRRRLTGAAHSAPRPRTCDHHLEQARWPQPTCTSHASALCTRISSPVLLLMTVRHRCVCRGPRTTCTSGRAARCSASAWSLSMTIFLNDCALRCARAARGLRLLQT